MKIKYRFEIFLLLLTVSCAALIFFVWFLIRSVFSEYILRLLAGCESGLSADFFNQYFQNGFSAQQGMAVLNQSGYGKSGLVLLMRPFKSILLVFVLISVIIWGILLLYALKLRKEELQKQRLLNCWIQNLQDEQARDQLLEICRKEDLPLIEELDNLNKKIVNQKKMLNEQKENMKGFVEDISHQLKTPLSILSLRLENNKDLENKNLCMECVEQMNELINSVLRMGMLESGAVRMKMKRGDFDLFLRECLLDIQPLAKKGTIEIAYRYEGNKELMFDEFWMGEAVINLLKNAVEHTPCGGKIELSAYVDARSAEVSLKDNGKPIEADQMEHLFDRFFTINAKQGSHGLGLSICFQVLKNHFGKIEVMNDEEDGVNFLLTFPVINR